jgi:hypothetical protein
MIGVVSHDFLRGTILSRDLHARSCCTRFISAMRRLSRCPTRGGGTARRLVTVYLR